MSKAALIVFWRVQLALAVMTVGLTPARAESVAISVSTSNNPGVGTPVACPLQLPAGVELSEPGAVENFVDCEFSVAGAGTFMVYGYVSAIDAAEPGANGFNALLSLHVTVVVEAPAVAQSVLANGGGVSVTISASENFAIPTQVASIYSSLEAEGQCNNPRDYVNGINFDNPGDNLVTQVINGTSTAVFNCPAFTSMSSMVQGEARNGVLALTNAGSANFPFGATVGDAVTLQLQQIAYNPTGGPMIALIPPPTAASPVCSLPPGGICEDFMNEFIPPPDPSTGFTIVYAGDVRNAIDIGNMGYDGTINPFAYQFPYRAGALMSLDANGNTEVTFVGPPLTGTETYCYNGPTSCSHNPHFGVDAVSQPCAGMTCPTLRILAQYWTNAPNIPFPSLSVSGPGLTGPTVDFVTLFAEVTSGGNTVGQWFTKPYSTNAPPLLCLANNTAAGETLSNAGFLFKTIAVLQSMNFGEEPPPGQPGSPFIGLPILNGLYLPSGGTFCFTAGIEPDIAVTTGDPSGQNVLTIPVNLANTGGLDAASVTITSIKPVLPATFIGPLLGPIGNISAGTTVSQNIQIDVTGLPSGSIAKFQINGSYQDGAGNNFQFSSVRGVKIP